jgi:hypothetical protein
MTARIHDESVGREQRFDLLKLEKSLFATRNEPRSRCVQDEVRTFNLRRQRRDACVVRCALGPAERSSRRFRPKASNRNSCDDQLVDRSQRWRERRVVQLGEYTLSFVEATDQ